MCREQLPVWQSFYEKHHGPNFELIAVAMDSAAPESARQFYDSAKTSFVRGVDRDDALFSTLDFQVVPNGIFIDENGIVRYAKFGGFEARPKAFSMTDLPLTFEIEHTEKDLGVLEELAGGLTRAFPALAGAPVLKGCAGLPTFTPERRAFDNPIAIACCGERAPCLPSRT